MLKILDVGCGDIPRGDVNVDVYKRKNPQIKQYEDVNIDFKNISNFILASGLCLPFKDACFERVVCHDVIEHTRNPKKMLDELIRVAKREVEIKTPHRFGKWAKLPYHKSYFNLKWFHRNVKLPMETETSFWFPLKFIGLLALPNMITVRVRKEV